MKNKIRIITNGAMVAALYVVLTLISFAVGLSSGAVQLRLSEALCILPIFMPEAIVGLTIGCLISNLITGCALWDIILGSLATLIGAIFTYLFRKNRYLACLPPIISNVAIIPPVLMYVYNVEQTYPYLLITIFLGEFISCGIFGQLLYSGIKKAIKSNKKQ